MNQARITKSRNAVVEAIRKGSLPRADTLLCSRCGKPAQVWHHHKGYAEQHKLDVVPLCKSCHVYAHGGKEQRLQETEDMRMLRKCGFTYDAIAALYSISRQAVYQRVTRH